MKLLVTGAAGCLGRAVCAMTKHHGFAVRGLGRGPRPSGVPWDGIEWVQGDLEKLDLDPVIAGCDAIVHFAALVHRPDIHDYDSYFRANVLVTERLVNIAARQGVSRFIFSSSIAVYGRDADLCADEDTPCAPRLPYGQSKLRAEKLVLSAGGTVLRLPISYGPGDRGNFSQLVATIARGRFVLPSPCDEPRSMLSSWNAAEAVRLALSAAPRGRLYLITDGEDVSMRYILGVISRALPTKRAVRTVPRAVLAPFALLGSAISGLGLPSPLTWEKLRKLTARLTFVNERSRIELGYSPVVSVGEGIAHAVRALLAHADWTPQLWIR